MLVSDFISNVEVKTILDEAQPLTTLGGSTCQLYMIRHYGKRLLLKMLKPELVGNPRYVEALRKEFVTGYRLAHPNLAQYNSLEQTADQTPYIVMEYIDGETLEELLKHNPAYFEDKAHLLKFCRQLLSCLSYLHSNQVLHLDLKPDNLMITRVSGDLIVIDFGFCYTDSYSETMGRNCVFSAPEQQCPDSNIDVRADIYAAGKLIELVCGNSRLAKKLSNVIARSTQSDPAQRYESAELMLADVERALTIQRDIFVWLSIILLAIVITLSISSYFRTTEPPESIFEETGEVTYRVLSESEKTCTVISRGSYTSAIPECYIINSYANRGHTRFKVVSVADSAFYRDTVVTSLSIAEGITTLGKLSFMFCANLRYVSLPTSLTYISSDAFSSCYKLQEVVLPRAIRRLEPTTFVGCSELRRVSFPDSLTIICTDCFVSSGLLEVELPPTLQVLERGVFFDCQRLRKVTLPASLESIGDFCFMRCDSLREVVNLNPQPIRISDVFEASPEVLAQRTLYVPASSVDAYKSALYWQDFGKILPIQP